MRSPAAEFSIWQVLGAFLHQAQDDIEYEIFDALRL
jgi:hypothetical protein